MSQIETLKPKRRGKNWMKLKGNSKTYFKQTTFIDFTPLEKKKKIQKKAILPTYNNDKKYFTPAFIIPQLSLQADQVLKEEYEKRTLENAIQIQLILIPKPRSKNKYCGVCRENYEEYLEHTMTEKHNEKLRKSRFQGYIVEINEKFKQQNQIKELKSTELFKENSVSTFCESASLSPEENTQNIVDACLNLA